LQYTYDLIVCLQIIFLLKTNCMNYDYLFEADLPDGVKSVFLNGKKISRAEFLERQKKLRKKKELKFES